MSKQVGAPKIFEITDVNCNCKACKLVAIFQTPSISTTGANVDHPTMGDWFELRLHKSIQQWKLQSFHQLGFSEIDKATNKFDEAQVIGEGAFGKVYYGKRKDGTPVAIKRGSGRHGQGKKEFKAEIEMLLNLRHHRLISLYELPTVDNNDLSNPKGSFGYWDPEYIRSQRFTEKSDVYSFGVVLFEILCGRCALDQTLPNDQVALAEWALHCCQNNTLDQIIDPCITGEISPDCLKIYVETAVNCLAAEGKDRPSMGDVLVNLQRALQLQESHSVFLQMPPDAFVERTALLNDSVLRLIFVKTCCLFECILILLGFELCFAINVGNLIFDPYSHLDDCIPGFGSVAGIFQRDTRWASSSELQFLSLEAGGYISNAFHFHDCSETWINVELRQPTALTRLELSGGVGSGRSTWGHSTMGPPLLSRKRVGSTAKAKRSSEPRLKCF
ncbi:hypothetical protein L1887_13730 [Cichorium endivia]|nr:hypothetical protein L1887_13730 [Cichorium endivia]